MFSKSIAAASLAAFALLGAAPANAAKLEKVDMVNEGIDMKPVVVKANSGGYTRYGSSNHRYLLRAYAKAKGSNRVYWVAVSNTREAHPNTFHPVFFRQSAGNGTEGWSVYKKSLTVDIPVDKITWTTPPKQLCEGNMSAEMKKGKSKADVLKSEWKLTTHAKVYFVAAADTKSNNKKNDHKITKIEVQHKGVVYPVQVVCQKGM